MRLSTLLSVFGLASVSLAIPRRTHEVSLQNKERDIVGSPSLEVVKRGGGSHPAPNWQCDGSGNDGYGPFKYIF